MYNLKVPLNTLLLLCVIPISIITPHSKTPPFLQNPSSWAQTTLNQLSLREKIGQLFIVSAISNDTIIHDQPYPMNKAYVESLITQYHVAGVIFLYPSKIDDQINLTNHYQNISTIPLLIAQDCEWGLTMRIPEAIQYPRAMTLGAIQDPSLIYQLGKEIGYQCQAIGVHINCAPVADINNNPYNPIINDRSFGDNPVAVSKYSVLYMHGMQDAGILACAKHFPGHGDTTTDSHENLPYITHSRERLFSCEFIPFINHIQQGVSSIMLAHLEVPALESKAHRPSSLSYAIVTQLLCNELGFTGLTITDAMDMHAIAHHFKPGFAELEAVLAGNDCILCPADVPQAIALIEQAVADGRITEEALDQRVLKILRAKEYLGLHKQCTVDLNEAKKILYRADAYALQDAVYRAAITLVSTPDTSTTDTTPQKSLQKTFVQKSFVTEPSVSVICTGNGSQEYYVNSLKNEYPTLSVIQIPHAVDEESLQQSMEQIPDAQTIIFSIHSSNKKLSQNFGITPNTIALVKRFKNAGKKLILVLFAHPHARALFPDVDICIYAYENTRSSQQAVIDILGGKICAPGKLPIDPIAPIITI